MSIEIFNWKVTQEKQYLIRLSSIFTISNYKGKFNKMKNLITNSNPHSQVNDVNKGN